MRLINEEEFRYDSLTDEEKKYIFNLFKDSYLKSVGTYWSEEKFIKKTKDWLFFGDKINGFIAAKENNGIFKLIISAGSLGSVINGINELLSLNKPVWGLSNDKLKNFLVKKFNFISPNKEEILKMQKLFSDEFLANKDYIINDDGTFTFNYDDVGVSNKYFVANELFFNKINKEKMNLSSLVNEENISPPNIKQIKMKTIIITEKQIKKVLKSLINEIKIKQKPIIKEENDETNENFSNWTMPSSSQLKQEFKIEQEMKGNNFWEDEESFFNAIENGKIVTINPNEDRSISYRSGTESYEELLRLIKGYRSYPQFRNEKTLKDIYDGFKNNQPMDYPIVIEDDSQQSSSGNTRKRVFSGNTRMDISFQLGINPKVLLIKGKL
jgi:hypothetical protein